MKLRFDHKKTRKIIYNYRIMFILELRTTKRNGTINSSVVVAAAAVNVSRKRHSGMKAAAVVLGAKIISSALNFGS